MIGNSQTTVDIDRSNPTSSDGLASHRKGHR